MTEGRILKEGYVQNGGVNPQGSFDSRPPAPSAMKPLEDEITLNLSAWIERRKNDVGPYADHIIRSTKEYEEEIADLRRQLYYERDKALKEAVKVCRRVSERYHDQFVGLRDIYFEGCSDGAMDCLEEIIVLQKETNKWTP